MYDNKQSAFISKPIFKLKTLSELGGGLDLGTDFKVKPFKYDSGIKPARLDFSASGLKDYGKDTYDYESAYKNAYGSSKSSGGKEKDSLFNLPDNETMQSFTGLASVLASAYDTYESSKTRKLLNRAYSENIKQAEATNAITAERRANFNRVVV